MKFHRGANSYMMIDRPPDSIPRETIVKFRFEGLDDPPANDIRGTLSATTRSLLVNLRRFCNNEVFRMEDRVQIVDLNDGRPARDG
jgi:hypothetical protein